VFGHEGGGVVESVGEGSAARAAALWWLGALG
jgi:Zn-dependent alcohol dehydrogenase